MISSQENLVDQVTFKTPATAWYVIRMENDSFSEEERALLQKHPVQILGGGSNVFFTQDFDGVALKPEIFGKEMYDDVFVRVGAGESWDDFVAWALDQGLYGLENLSLIPGTVGAAPVQNIGAYGVEVKEYIHQVEGIHIPSFQQQTYTNDACNFSYRNSIFKEHLRNSFVITYVVFKLSRTPNPNTAYATLAAELEQRGVSNPTPKDVREAVISVRTSRLPDWREIPNAGSFFKNPTVSKKEITCLQAKYPEIPHHSLSDGSYKIPAAWFLDQAGWKGKWSNNVGCYEKQPLIVVTNGKASGAEIRDFTETLIQEVQRNFGVTLVPEVLAV